MKSGKILLMVLIVLSSAISLAVMQDFSFEEKKSIIGDNYSSNDKTITVEVSDGIGSVDKG